MPTSVSLQGNFIYGITPLVLLFLVLISPLIMKIKRKRAEKRKRKEEAKASVNTNVYKPVPLSVKQQYVRKLKKIDADYKKGSVDLRNGYQLLSAIIRQFVLEYKGIDVSTKTLAEIRRMDIPDLERLMEEYYEPEFSADSTRHLEYSLEKTIEAIEKWN